VSDSFVAALPLSDAPRSVVLSPFIKSVTVRVERNRHRERGKRGESKNRNDCTESLTGRINRRVECPTTRMARRLLRRAKRECWRGTQEGHKESAASTKNVV